MPQRRRCSRTRRSARIGLGLTTVLAVGSACVSTGAAPVVVTDPGAPARLDEVTVQRFEYPTHGSPDPDQNWADLYLPAGEQRVDSIPLAVLIHGGAWQDQIGADSFDPLARKLASRGMAVYNIEYRRVGSGGGWPTTFHDVASALDHVVEVDKRFPQITTDDELVVGHSAGAQLAVWGGTRHLLDDDEVGAKPAFRPTRVVSIAGPLDMVYAATHGDDRIVTAMGGTPSEVSGRYAKVDPIQNIDPGTPVVAMHGARDVTVAPENSQRYVDAVTRAGGKAKMILFNDEDHVSLVSGDSRAYPRVLEIIRHVSAADLHETTA
ncbi:MULTISPECIES: alpha/beta hydrolase family protein [Dietzia]|uniref:alpha/beta hydrolase family protein n=1 Tax=Dietzia TaxID=37914 RepID=UPI0015FC2C1F|nr:MULTISPECIES: prolyl oligopeptidase family serine peptidase [Dietzia]MBB1034767.1 prolyl oligopeptidase family serine peptidase [Dietzia sp. CQ4]MBB1038900.1 prolyl oligopeptidase family serine peptidase [Dietzia natronolimnaea]MCT1514615.1 alpha/beta fold hydrolase [Dietzia cercidiphylli]